MRPVAALVAAVGFAAAASTRPVVGIEGQRRQESAIEAREQLRDWLAAVSEHGPGLADPPVTAVGSWSSSRLADTIASLRRLAAHEPVESTLLRGALLHLDAVVLGVATTTGGQFERFSSPVVQAHDALGAGHTTTSVHLEVARQVLDLVTPRPATNAGVRKWYAATTAWLAGTYRLADLRLHLDRATALFGRDPVTRFHRGCLSETLGSPQVTAAVTSAGLQAGLKIDVPPYRTSLTLAELDYRQALDWDEGLVEARIRLARVVSLTGRHGTAVEMLTRVLGNAALGSRARFDALLFLARARELSGRLPEARRDYESALGFFPLAQSAQLGLARLSDLMGAPQTADELVQRLLTTSQPRAGADDPWWTYHQCAGRDRDAILASLRDDNRKGGR